MATDFFLLPRKGGSPKHMTCPPSMQLKFFNFHKEVQPKTFQSPHAYRSKLSNHRMIGHQNLFLITIYNAGCLNVNEKFPTCVAFVKMDVNMTLDTKRPRHISFDNPNICKLLGIYRLGCSM
jgi:hypothetical protein